MDSTWALMQAGTAAGYMYQNHLTETWGAPSFVNLPYPESGHISGVLFKRFAEEEFLGLMLMFGPPPHTIRLAGVSYHSAYLDSHGTPTNLLGAVRSNDEWMEQLKQQQMDGFIITNAMKEYHNFEFLRQLGKHDD